MKDYAPTVNGRRKGGGPPTKRKRRQLAARARLDEHDAMLPKTRWSDEREAAARARRHRR